MTGQVLVVDDILSNVKLLEAKLTAEYFEVTTAFSGAECFARMDEGVPDLILLDVMMPGMDGFEVCRRIKSNPKTAHVPVVMVTALDQPSDRVAGLDAGADDFLTKPVDDAALIARVRSLVRLKMMTDEFRMRESTGQDMGLIDPAVTLLDRNHRGRILVIEDRAESVAWFTDALTPKHEVSSADTFEEALVRVKSGDFDLIVVSLGMRGFDGLRLCSQLRSQPEGRHVPILVVVSEGDRRKLTLALEMGVNDYLTRPVDRNELVARVRTQLRKKRYVDALKSRLEQMFVRLAQPQPQKRSKRSKAARLPAPSSQVIVRAGPHWDVFISHASEDKVSVARPLSTALERLGLRVWLDENELRIGDSLRRKIDDGLGQSLFGVVVLSKSFFAKDWPRRELDGLSALESVHRKVILPVWHEVDQDDVAKFSPMLADKYAGRTSHGLGKVAIQIAAIVNDQRQPYLPPDREV